MYYGDELRYHLWQYNGCVRMSRMPSERYLQNSVVSTGKFGGGGIMVCFCFSLYGLSPLVLMPGNMNAEAYETILDNSALPILWLHFGLGLFQI